MQPFFKGISQYKNLHYGETCVIIGNGPSLKSTSLEGLSDLKVFGLNKIYLYEPTLPIDYLVCVNKLVMSQGIKPEKFQVRPKLFLTCRSLWSYFYRDRIIINDFDCAGGWYEECKNSFSQGGTVTYVALQLAHYMGFRKVILVGVDHSFMQKGSPNETQMMTGHDRNHFHEDYFKGQKWQLADLNRSEFHYRLAKDRFVNEGRDIVDCTVGGKLQVFRKSTLSKELSESKA